MSDLLLLASYHVSVLPGTCEWGWFCKINKITQLFIHNSKSKEMKGEKETNDVIPYEYVS